MVFPSNEIVDSIKRRYPRGTRVRLEKMDDPQAPPVGTMGTVMDVDAIGTVFARWDNGSCLGAVYGVDEICKVCSADDLLAQ